MKNNDYNLSDEPNLPLDNNGKNPFGLPEDYFSKFEDNLNKKIEFENELEEFPILSSLERTKSFIVPFNYFESTENSLEYKTELELYSRLYSIKKPVLADLEEDYRQQLELSINHKIEIVEELKPYETLYAIDKVNSFVTSENYFESLVDRVKAKIYSVKEKYKSIIEIALDVIFGKTIAFSLGVTLIVGLSFYFLKTPEIIAESSDCKTLACLEKNEILNNNKIVTNFDEDQLIDLVDVKTLHQQLNSKKEETTSDAKLNKDSISEDDLLDEL